MPLAPGLFSEGGVAVTGYTLSGRHSRALRDVIDYSRVIEPQLALSWELLESLRTLLGCDHIMIEGCDYGQQALYFSQRIWAGKLRSRMRSTKSRRPDSGSWSYALPTLSHSSQPATN